MDSSSPPSPPPPAPPPPPSLPPPLTTKINEKTIILSNTNAKPKASKKKPPKIKKEEDNEIVVLSEKRDINPQPSSSSSSSSSAIIKRPIPKEKPTNTYVLMRHRRCYSIQSPPCLHSLTLEYNICREHTIRHMCRTQRVLRRRKFKPKSKKILLIDEVAKCLKTIVNHVIDIEENRLELTKNNFI
jgi:hypothetical protein